MNILSLFDGISCGRIALNRAGIKHNQYFASEIDPYAIKVTQHNFPDTIQVGDVAKVYGHDLPKIDLMLAGSPCQGFSSAGKQLNFEDPRSKLFFEFVRLLNETKPKYFLLENVNMKQAWQDVISSYLGVEPVRINSNLVSAQNRDRLYWTNIPFDGLPEDRGILLKDILETNEDCYGIAQRGRKNGDKYDQLYEFNGTQKANCLTRATYKDSLVACFKHSEKAIEYMNRKTKDGRTHWDFKHHSDSNNNKSSCVVSNFAKGVPYNVLIDRTNGTEVLIRYFTPIECERLQTVPDNYTDCICKTQRYKALGNGWTVDVIVHILKGILNDKIC